MSVLCDIKSELGHNSNKNTCLCVVFILIMQPRQHTQIMKH